MKEKTALLALVNINELVENLVTEVRHSLEIFFCHLGPLRAQLLCCRLAYWFVCAIVSSASAPLCVLTEGSPCSVIRNV